MMGKCLLRGRWGHSEAMQWPASPPWGNEDVSHLLSTLMAGLRMGTHIINTFIGDATPGKTKVSFKQWYCEV